MLGKFEIFEGHPVTSETSEIQEKQWYFRLVAHNGETLCVSEGHQNHSDVVALHTDYFVQWELVESIKGAS